MVQDQSGFRLAGLLDGCHIERYRGRSIGELIMLNILLLILLLSLTQSCLAGQAGQEGIYPYEPIELKAKSRERIERDKRELVNIEDLVVGSGAVAAWGRKIGADIEVRYTDGTLVFRGPIYDYVGFLGDTGLHNAADQREEPGMLAMNQRGIVLGLNGMAIGGHRRFTVPPLVCERPNSKGNPRATCQLIHQTRQDRGVKVREVTLIVEATLTEACIPLVEVLLRSPMGTKTQEVGCRRSDEPKLDPTAPLWHLY